MRITSKGQVTIPIEIREQAGLLPETDVAFEIEGSTVRIVKVASKAGESRGEAVLRRLAGSATVKMTTGEIMALTRDAGRARPKRAKRK
jgi:bifunctional DNA-binding transcriptional regulator/antitoxin component of YhaV-PrlF toxin-antitoxin module